MAEPDDQLDALINVYDKRVKAGFFAEELAASNLEALWLVFQLLHAAYSKKNAQQPPNLRIKRPWQEERKPVRVSAQELVARLRGSRNG